MNESRNEDKKDDFRESEDRFAQLGQQAGAIVGQLFEAAEQFGRKVSESHESDPQAYREPFYSAVRAAGEEFRASANHAADSFSDALRQSSTNPVSDVDIKTTNTDASGNQSADESMGVASGRKTGVRKIGGGPVDQEKPVSAAGSPSDASLHTRAGDINDSDGTARQRAEVLAAMFYDDASLSRLTPGQFEALRSLLTTHYRGVRELQENTSQ